MHPFQNNLKVQCTCFFLGTCIYAAMILFFLVFFSEQGPHFYIKNILNYQNVNKYTRHFDSFAGQILRPWETDSQTVKNGDDS